MRKVKNMILFLLISTFSFGQPVERIYKESTEQFVTRFMPLNSKLLQNFLDTKWNNKPVIIAFYEQNYKLPVQDDPDQQDYLHVIGEIFIRSDSNHYNKFVIDTIENEGGEPKIESVFFANADKDMNKELLIIVSWPQQHAGVNGILYGTYVYDDLIKTTGKKLKYLESISEKLSGGCECEYEDGKREKAKYTNASEIRTALKRLGYK